MSSPVFKIEDRSSDFLHNRLIDRLILAPAKHFYFRLMWPYMLSQVQLPILRYRKLAQVADIQPGDSVLELASGAIPYHLLYQHKTNPSKITITDGHKATLSDCRRISRGWNRVRTLLGYADSSPSFQVVDSTQNFPFASRSFDRVIAARIYELEMREAYRVLRMGGKIAVSGASMLRHAEDLIREGRLQKEPESDVWADCVVYTKVG